MWEVNCAQLSATFLGRSLELVIKALAGRN